MSGLEDLTAMIYHERQQEGSMLCAQHALNSLLQGNYFTAPDLAAIANGFDALERQAMGDVSLPESGGNMDDTGFFSVQVMDKALDVWGLDLIRWRSPVMRHYQDSPHKQLAFVLNLHQHWFTLRRFGPASSSHETDEGEGFWFNLNSQYTAPKWVSRTYLGMFLQQSEEEGYSVFAVIQRDPSQPLALPRTQADQAAALLEAPDSLPGHSSSTSATRATSTSGGESEQIVIPDDIDYDVANEDVELQAALAASLTGSGAEYGFEQHAYVPQAPLPVPAPELRRAPEPPQSRTETTDSMDVDLYHDIDPVAASAARSRAMLEQMQRMQEAALRETRDESPSIDDRRQRRAQEEADELERAIQASIREHGTSGAGAGAGATGEATTREESESLPRSTGISTPTAAAEQAQTRVYDDEDAELQAALRASLETMPEGFIHATPPPQPVPSKPPPSEATEVINQVTSAKAKERTPSETDESVGMGSEDASLSSEPSKAIDPDEMRKARLARFGGAS